MINAVSFNGVNSSKKQNLSFEGSLNLVVKKELYRAGEDFAKITIKNIGKAHPNVLGCNNHHVESIYEMAKQFVKLIPDNMKLFFDVRSSNGKSVLKRFYFKIGESEFSQNFTRKFYFAEALNTEAKKRNIYSHANIANNPQVEKFTRALDEYADFFSIRARIDRTRIIDVDAQKAVNTKVSKVSKSKQKQLDDFAESLKGLLPDDMIKERVAQMAKALT